MNIGLFVDDLKLKKNIYLNVTNLKKGFGSMILNWKDEITKIDPDIKFRAHGGW